MLQAFEAGVFLIDKPVGVSSFTVVCWVRKALGIKKVGHAGTLDPFASGLLVVCAGRKATREISRIMEGEKTYLATLCLGMETTTGDPEGEVISRCEFQSIPEHEIENTLKSFIGRQWQRPPAYSACKHKGKPLYYYARKGITIEKEPREIEISSIEWLDRRDVMFDNPEIQLEITCSKGTYIRTLGTDIGKALQCCGYLTGLRRTACGRFNMEKSVPGEKLREENSRELLLSCMISVEELGNLLQ